jgi:beta-glucosidase/6-phospho-beta-glucosidase/beta-galactosidase
MAVVCLLQVKQAVEDGYDLRGYHYWTLLDDYEFNYGYDLKFGLYAWDPKDTDSRRTERAGAKVSIPSLAVNLRNRKHKR